MCRSSFLRFLPALVCCICFVTVPGTTEAENIRTKEILKAWKRRQDRVRSCRFVWEKKRIYPRGTLEGNPERRTNPPHSLPPEDTTVKSEVILTLDGDKMRYTTKGLEWRPEQERFEDTFYVSVCDGEHSKSYYGYPEGTQKIGFVNKERNRNLDAVQDTGAGPILLTYRACDPMIGVRAVDKLMVLEEKAVFQECECFVLEAPIEGSFLKNIYWVDPSRDYCIVRRMKVTRAGAVLTQESISHQLDANFGWIPIAWEFTILNGAEPKKVTEHVEARVSKFEVNISVDPEEFKFSFPPGTAVLDHEQGRKLFVVEENNERREIQGLEELEQSPLKKRGNLWRYTLRAALALLVLLCCFFAGKRFLRKKRTALSK